jgi:hypothetical protein
MKGFDILRVEWYKWEKDKKKKQVSTQFNSFYFFHDDYNEMGK